MTTLTERLATGVVKLRLDDVPERVIDIAISQIIGHLGALAAGAGHDLGRRVVHAFGPPFAFGHNHDPARTAYTAAALTMLLDYDDTMYAGHPSHSTVGVPLAYAASLKLDGPSLLSAVIAANEVATRVTAAATLGHFRGQTAAHTHLAGAVAGRGKAAGTTPSQLVNAWGIAFAEPPWPLTRAFMGSEAKVLTASTPIRMALDAYDAATAGIHGATDILEHPDGFLARFAERPLPEAIDDIGTRWHTETLSIKVYPGCAYLDSALDAAVTLHPALTGRIDEIERVVVNASIFTVGMDARSAAYIANAESPPTTLGFSVPYNVATALLRGDLTPADLDRDRVRDPAVWALAAKVEVHHDPAATKRALLATAPVGAALRTAGESAATWLAPLVNATVEEVAAELAVGPEASFETAEKAISARVSVHFQGGEMIETAIDIPKGAAGPDTRRHHREIARHKFDTAFSAPVATTADAVKLATIIESLTEANAEDVGRAVSLLGTALENATAGGPDTI